MVNIAVILSIVFISIVIIFQLALASGVPWGILAMGGKYPGKFPLSMRIAASVQAVLIAIIGLVIAIRGGFLLTDWFSISESLIWGVVAFNGLGLVANLATPSKWERIIWAPVVAILLVCSVVVALS